MNKLLVIARHEIKVRFFSKVIAFNLLILLAVVSITPWLPSLIDSHKALPLGIYATDGVAITDTRPFQESLAKAAESQGLNIAFIIGGDLAELKAVSDKEKFQFAIGVTPTNFTITQFDSNAPQLLAFLNTYSQAIATNEYLVSKGLNLQDFTAYVKSHSAAVDLQLKKSKELTQEQYFTAMILTLLLFTLIVLASTHLVMGVVEEKSSHVMEIILYSVRPRELLLGKLAGISLFIFLQFLLLISVGYTSASFAGTVAKAHLSLASAGTVLLWFPPAFIFFAILFAALGARTSRVEEIGAVQAPLMFLVTGSLYASIFSINDPHADWVQIATYIPPVSFFMESTRTLLGTNTGSEGVISWAIAVAATILVAAVGVKTFEKKVFATN